jgi:hypothetical protein
MANVEIGADMEKKINQTSPANSEVGSIEIRGNQCSLSYPRQAPRPPKKLATSQAMVGLAGSMYISVIM